MDSSQHDIDIRLGELAVAMEIRVHGDVSTEVVRGVNNRDPLERRTLGERFLETSPLDGMLLVDANANAELVHVVANNGLCGRSRHSTVPRHIEEALQKQLLRALDEGDWIPLTGNVPGPPTGRDQWVWTATESRGGMIFAVYQRSNRTAGPVAIFAVGKGKKGFLSWEAVWRTGPPPATHWPEPPMWETDGPLNVPNGRWLVSRLLPFLLSTREDAYWLIGFSRCVAWAWFLLERPHLQVSLGPDTASPTIERWHRAIVRSMETSGMPVKVDGDEWGLAASDGQSHMEETCLGVTLWALGASGSGKNSAVFLTLRPRPNEAVRIDRVALHAGLPIHPDLDDYLQTVLAAAVARYWKDAGVVCSD